MRVAVLIAVLAAAGSSEFTEVRVVSSPDHEVRYTSGNTIYVEALVDERWVGRYWAADGRINFPRGQFNPPYWEIKEPAFEIDVENEPAAPAVSLATGWHFVSASELPAKHFIVQLTNAAVPLDVNVHTLLDGTPVLTRWIEITNRSQKPLAITGLYPWAGRLWTGAASCTLGYQRSERIGQFEWQSLPSGTTSIESVKGNGEDDPFFVLRNETAGEYFAGSLAWTANWRMDFTRDEHGVSFRIGPRSLNPLRIVAPGETIRSPAVHIGHTEGDFDAAVQSMHTHIRLSVLPQRERGRAYLVEYGIPGDQGYYTGEAFNEENVKKSIDVAAAVGAELFIIDAGWWDVYGEWTASPQRFPHGLLPLVDYAHSTGLLFGIYAEPEGGRGNWTASEVFKRHPDWFSPQHVLRLEKPEAAAWFESEIKGILERYKPDLYRHDFIPGYTGEGTSTLRNGFLENDYWRYYSAFYGVWERIRQRYPNLILQMCSNGGFREDLAMISHFDQSYSNEGFTPDSYAGKTVALPPEILNYGWGAATEKGQLDTRLRLTFTLSAPWILNGAAPSVAALTPAHRARYLHYCGIYKNFIRPLLPAANIYHHAPVSAHGGVSSGAWFAVEFSAPDRSKGWATIVRLKASGPDIFTFKPRGLDPAKTYRVTFDSIGTAATSSGLELMRSGISIRLEAVRSSELLLFEAGP